MSTFESEFTGVRRISVEQPSNGDIAITTSPDDTVRSRVTNFDTSDPQLRFDQSDDRLVIKRSGNHWNQARIDIALEIPAGLDITAVTSSGDLFIDAIIATGSVKSGSGDIAISQVGTLAANSGSGDIAVTTVSGSAEVSTGSGDISVGEAAGPISAKSGSGDIQIARLRAGIISASSGSGDISVPDTNGSVNLRSASGSIDVGIADGLPAWLDVSSISGEISIDLDSSQQPAEGQPYLSVRCRTASGEIDVHRAAAVVAVPTGD